MYICSGVGQNDMQEEELKLNNEMRESWMQHIYWELIFQSAFLNDLPGKSAVEERLLQTAEDIASVFAPFYSENKISALTDLLEEHIEIAGKILQAMKDGDIEEEEKQDALWRDNAAGLAKFWSDNNSEYDYGRADHVPEPSPRYYQEYHGSGSCPAIIMKLSGCLPSRKTRLWS